MFFTNSLTTLQYFNSNEPPQDLAQFFETIPEHLYLQSVCITDLRTTPSLIISKLLGCIAEKQFGHLDINIISFTSR